jgi:hypothetical protein
MRVLGAKGSRPKGCVRLMANNGNTGITMEIGSIRNKPYLYDKRIRSLLLIQYLFDEVVSA